MRHNLPPLWTREVVPQNVEAGLGSVKRRFVMHEAVLQHLARLLLPRPIRVLEPLAHLLEGGRIVVASCVPLTQDLERRRRTLRLIRTVGGSPPVAESEPADQAPDGDRPDDDPEEPSQDPPRDLVQIPST